MSQEATTQLKSALVGNTIESIKYYNVNDNFFVFEEERYALIDGGVTLGFKDHEFSFGWNHELELFDGKFTHVTELLGELDYYKIKESNFIFVSTVKGLRIKGLFARWIEYNPINENLEILLEQHYALKELVLELEGGSTLQLAAVDYDLHNESVSGFRFSNAMDLLISFDRIFDITS